MSRALFSLVMLCYVSSLGQRAAAVGVPKTCAVRSPELKLARECFTGDMATPAGGPQFVGVDESSPADLNYCFNALIVPYPVEGARLSLLVLKDDERGQPVAQNYAVSVAAVAATLGRVPLNRNAQIVTLKDLTARCYARQARTDSCSKGFFGFGSTDLPFSISLEGDARAGYKILGGVRDRAMIEQPGVARVSAVGVAPAARTLEYLVEQVKDRILTRARRDLASVRSDAKAKDELNANAAQFRYCRLAVDGLNHRLRRPDPFSATDRKMLEDLDAHLSSADQLRAPAHAAKAAESR